MSVNWGDLIATPSEGSERPARVWDGNSTYGEAALRDEARKVALAPNGSRNDTLNTAAFRMGQLITEGHLARTDVESVLFQAAMAAGLGADEIGATLNSGLRGAVRKPRDNVPDPAEASTLSPPDVTEVDAASLLGLSSPKSPQSTAEIVADLSSLWEQRPVLAHIREFALSRMCSPAAVLGVVLLRALAITPPTVVLPALIGGVGSLNLFAALVGPSGSGKGAAEVAARDAFLWPEYVHVATVGSGEGIAHQYAHIEKGEQVDDRQSVLFTVSEVDSLSAIAARQGATLLSQLRAAFSGERLGFSYADRSRRLLLERHGYRLEMIVGVQPERALGLLNDADGGTPQRFIWVPATDSQITATPGLEPRAWPLTAPKWVERTTPNAAGFNVVRVPDEVARQVRENHAARARGEGNALDGHAMFAREKVAFALAVLDGRAEITLEDWRISGMVMNLSEVTRAAVERSLVATRERKQEREITAEIRRQALLDDARRVKGLNQARAALERQVAKGPSSRADLRKAITPAAREHFEEALEVALSLGTIRDESTVDRTCYVKGVG